MICRKLQESLVVTLLGAFLLLSWTGNADARDPVAGKERAAMCATCHGPLGLSQLPNAPNLAGQPALYLAEQLKNYRSGKPLTDQEIDNLAAWYESIRISVAVP